MLFLMKILLAKSIAPDEMPHSRKPHLDLYCLPAQGRSYDFVIDTAIGEASGDRLGPQRVQGRHWLGAQGAKPLEAPAFLLFSIARNAFKF